MAGVSRRACLLIAATFALVSCKPAGEPSSGDQIASSSVPAAILARHWFSVSVSTEVQARLGGLSSTAMLTALTASFDRDSRQSGLLTFTPKETCSSPRPVEPEQCADGLQITVDALGGGYVLTVEGSVAGHPVNRSVERCIEDLNVDGWSSAKAARASAALGPNGFIRSSADDTPSGFVWAWEADYAASLLNDIAEIGQDACLRATNLTCASPRRWPMGAAPWP